MLRFKLIDDEKIIADKKSNNFKDFENIIDELKIKYKGKK